MKFIKCLFLALVVSTIFAISGVSAQVLSSTWTNLTLFPNGLKRSLSYLDKPDYQPHVLGVLNTTNDRDVSVQLLGISPLTGNTCYSAWQIIETPGVRQEKGFKAVENIQPADMCGLNPGRVVMFIKTRNVYSSETSFSGTWYVSTSIYNQM